MKKQVRLFNFDGCKWSTFFDPNTGFYLRKELGKDEPFWGPLPELLDISITNSCGKGCSYCYQNATPGGRSMSLDEYRSILSQVKGHVQQVALGGGEPTEHPEFIELLRTTREDFDIIPSYTTNGSPETLTDEIVEATKKYCGAVAVSWHEGSDKQFALKRFLNADVTTNIHFIVDASNIDKAIEMLEERPFTEGINAIIFLLHKPVGRAAHGKLVLQFDEKVQRFLDLAQKDYPFQVGFDACFASALTAHTDITQDCYDTCDGGRFSCYIDADMNVSPCSFDKRRHYGSLNESTLEEIWMGEAFTEYRSCYREACSSCTKRRSCMGGCALHPEVVMCEKDKRTTGGFANNEN